MAFRGWKKTMLSGALFMLLAQTASAEFDFYVGGVVGVGVPELRHNSHNNATNERHHVVGGGTNFLGGALLGVENTWCGYCGSDFWTALEINALYNSYNKTIRRSSDALGVNDYQVKVKNNFQYGADLKFGIPVDCCGTAIPYLLVGISAGEWKTTLSNNTTAAVFGIPAGASTHFGKTQWGPNAGLGVRFKLTDCITADLQYAYTWFTHKGSSKTSIPTTDPATIQEWRHTARVNQNRVLLALNFPLNFFGGW